MSMNDEVPIVHGTGIKEKLTMMVIVLVVLSTLTVSAMTLFREIAQRQAELATDTLALAATLAELGVSGVNARNRQELESLNKAAGQRQDLRYIAFHDNEGQVLASRLFFGGEPDNAAALPPFENAGNAVLVTSPTAARIFQGADLEVVAPVGSRSGLTQSATPAIASATGYIRVMVSLRPVRTDLLQDLGTTTLNTFVLLFIAVAAALRMTRRIVDPLTQLAGMADRIAHGELGVSVEPSRDRELRKLGDAFNRMSSRLQEAQSRLRAYSQQLEELVAARTRELRNATRHAYQLAQHDTLTGLPNRTLLASRLHLAVALAERRNDKIAVIQISLNDVEKGLRNRPREAADDLLRAVASRLVSSVRNGDTVARGDHCEFVVVVADIAGASADHLIATIVDNIGRALQSSFRVHEEVIRVSAQIGVSIFPDDDTEPRLLLANARATVQHAQPGGPAAYFSKEAEARMARRSAIDAVLQQAAQQGGFKVLFDPILDLRHHTVLGVTAVLRWDHPQLGPLDCAEFMQVAEHAGMEMTLLTCLLREVGRHLAERGDSPEQIRHVRLKLTRKQFESKALIDTFHAGLKDAGRAAREFVLVIPESAIGVDIGHSTIILRELSQTGAGIIVDEYGTGGSNLSDLARLPVEAVAIDKCFILGLTRNASDRAVLQAYISMAQSLGIRPIATGITDAAQLEFLLAHGCNEGSGPYLAGLEHTGRSAQYANREAGLV